MALLLNKRNVKGSKFWRAFPILAYAIPGFISMLGFKYMFSQSGPINYYLDQAGLMRIFFLTNDASAKWWARSIGPVREYMDLSTLHHADGHGYSFQHRHKPL